VITDFHQANYVKGWHNVASNKTTYICGDSFAASDNTSKIVPWHEQFECINFARDCATNLNISKQVDKAIQFNAKFIIVLFTTCVRQDWKGTFYTFHNLENNPANLSSEQVKLLKEYFVEFFELDLEIYRNKCIIESVLQRLVDSGIPFLFDQGGFEHPKFGTTKSYFEKYNQYRSKYCLWDYGDSKVMHPSFHIADQELQNCIAEYYNG